MFQILYLPKEITTIISIGETERLLIEIALNYTLHQIQYDGSEHKYCLPTTDQRFNHQTIFPEELKVLENLSARFVRVG